MNRPKAVGGSSRELIPKKAHLFLQILVKRLMMIGIEVVFDHEGEITRIKNLLCMCSMQVHISVQTWKLEQQL